MTIDPPLAAALSDLAPPGNIDKLCWWSSLRRAFDNPAMFARFRAATGNQFDFHGMPPMGPLAFTENQRAYRSAMRGFAKWHNRVVWDRRTQPMEGRWEG